MDVLKSIFISAIHIRGIENGIAMNQETRITVQNGRLKMTFLTQVNWFQVKPTFDLFASRINCKVKRFIALQADPEAIGVDAL